MKPFNPDQDLAIDFALERQGCNVFARPGKGKTRIALETIASTGKRTLVLAPLFPALTAWRQENKKWGYDFDMRVLHGKDKTIGSEDVSVINYDGLPWLLEHPHVLDSYEYVIYDEVSKMKNPGTRRFRKWRKHMPSFDYRLGLTGTPMGNRLMDLWGEMYCVDLGETLGRTLYKYQREFFVPHPYIQYAWIPKDDSRDAVFELIRPNAISLDFHDGEMPGLTINPVNLKLPPGARKAYEEMKAAMVIEGTDVVAVNAGVRSQKLRQIAAGAVYDHDGDVLKLHKTKQTALQNLVEELQGDPLLVFFEFKHDLTAIRDVLGADVLALDGNTKPEDMVTIVQRWNNGELPVLAAHPKTAGMGGNMQESGRNVAFYTCPWSLEDVEQGIGRVWRQGQERDVIVHMLICTGTKDDDVVDAVFNEKKEDQDALFAALARH